MSAQIPGFSGFRPMVRQEAAGCAHAHDCGDVDAPQNGSVTVFRFRAPDRMSIKNPIIYCGELHSPGGDAVVAEAWKNGAYGGSVTLEHGANRFERAMPLEALDLIEVRVGARGTGGGASVRDLWVLFTA